MRMIMNQNSSSQSQWQAVEAAEKVRAIYTPWVISVWVAPVIVLVAVIVIGLAVAGFLLGAK